MIDKNFRKKVFGMVMVASLVVTAVVPNVVVKAETEEEPSYPTVYKGIDYAPVYDYNYYTKNNVDVAMAFPGNKEKVLKHFVENGMKEKRAGNATFFVKGYKNRYADLRAAFGDDLVKYYEHYVTYGVKEKRDGSKWDKIEGAVTKYKGIDYKLVYDFETYKNRYKDLQKAFGDDDDVAYLKHFVEYGMNEGRDAKEEFSIKSYKNANADLRKAFRDDLKQYYMHYIYYGNKEGRPVTGYDNTIKDPITEYKGVDYKDVFDAETYYDNYIDLELAFGLDDQKLLEHFVNMGMAEGRMANSTFNVKDYRNNYKDLQNAFGNDLKSYYLHYINYGKEEERIAKGPIPTPSADSNTTENTQGNTGGDTTNTQGTSGS
ncbi:hypothetical protein [Lachnobacterium bovis]|uniref:hypothetical protein n=1 Tax=Lachnobacterium bovis TaxID=140626 RepID=UPI0003B35388|nr:hypothetical protein [Lachnobacterium bovis]